MQSKLFLLTILLICGYATVVAHIVTSVGNMQLLNCMKELNDALQNHYCPLINEDYASGTNSFQEHSLEIPLSESQEVSTWFRSIKECCTRPCFIGELISIC